MSQPQVAIKGTAASFFHSNELTHRNTTFSLSCAWKPEKWNVNVPSLKTCQEHNKVHFPHIKGFVRLALTCGVAAAGRAALSRPLQVEAILAALAVAAFRVSLTVDAVQTQRVVQAVLRSPIALTTHYRCMRT